METPTIKEIVKDNKVYFDSYRAGFFYYNVTVGKITYQFNVDREDIGDATLMSSDKAMFFMRWIRKAIKNNQLIVIEDRTLPDIKCDQCGEQLIARLEFYTGTCDGCMNFPEMKYSEDYVDDNKNRKLIDKTPSGFEILGSDEEVYFPDRKKTHKPSKNNYSDDIDDSQF